MTPQVRRNAVGMIGVLVVAIAAGTATTGAGPHAGGTDAKRIPVPLADMARIHSSIVLLLGALTLVELWLIQRSSAPESVAKRGQILLAVMVVQGLVGYTQYFTKEPALVVGIHIAGALSVWLCALWFYDGLSHHPAEASPEVTPSSEGMEPAGETSAAGETRAAEQTSAATTAEKTADATLAEARR